jgi:hypothetical protein
VLGLVGLTGGAGLEETEEEEGAAEVGTGEGEIGLTGLSSVADGERESSPVSQSLRVSFPSLPRRLFPTSN